MQTNISPQTPPTTRGLRCFCAAKTSRILSRLGYRGQRHADLVSKILSIPIANYSELRERVGQHVASAVFAGGEPVMERWLKDELLNVLSQLAISRHFYLMTKKTY